jgi:signal peptidase I
MKQIKLKETMIEILSFLPVIIFSWLLTTFVIANAVVPTGSMESTIMTGSRLIGNRLAYKGSDPHRKDIVIFKAPDNESIFYVKRIIGLPGDTVEIIQTDSESKTGNVYINGHPIYEDYLNEPMIVEEYMKFEVPKDSYFCMGDNRNKSFDARYWENTFVKKDKITAKVLFQYWKGFKKL